MPNFLTITAIKRVLKGPHSKCYMAGGAEHRSYGIKSVRRLCLDRIWSRKLRDKCKKSEIISNLGKRVMLIIDVESTFEIGDHVYLKVSPIRGLRRFKVKGKLAPRYIGPFRIVDRKGAVAYQLELPAQLSGVHDVFHVSQLKKCLRVPEEQIPLEEVDTQEDLTYSEYPVKILEVSERVTRNKKIKMCKVQWKHHTEAEATWEREDDLKTEYPHLFFLLESRGRDSA
ncbi:LOW QUALITY PROTEIN: hypothetical protein U9M48_027420 [Paspalum notatum var. saurae]|uniref:Tf2-1-like SH3-like domain-containing protein n=1 Tax=Paspalum notatum var. saurae TaxID=547442 RepID=A0AAQ3TYU3_PASNO